MRHAGMKRRVAVFCFAILCLGSAGAAEPGKLFAFHSGFWINLHHFLYRQGQLVEPQKGPHDLSLSKADSEEAERLTAEERGPWSEAVAYYGRTFAKRDLLFDNELRETKDQLEDAEDSPDLANAAIPAELKAVLLKAAPIYRKHWWGRQEAGNRAWIAHLEPLVERLGATLSARVSSIYGMPWPGYPVRVDVVAYANWAGAYTSIEPTRPTISSVDAGNQDVAALEILLHETTHGMMDKVMGALKAAEAKVNAEKPGAAFHVGSIWHAVLFYTAGELVAEQTPCYTPYADKGGMWARGWPSQLKTLLEQDWKPHMNGGVTLEQALTKLVSDLAAAGSH